ncbi:MAG: hypothetical protein L0H84_11570 [Pseudonocardia sp.]|nr:hypothetical protein [Pseudonocardia sp.]
MPRRSRFRGRRACRGRGAAVRAGHHACLDRAVFQIAGAGWDVGYVEAYTVFGVVRGRGCRSGDHRW